MTCLNGMNGMCIIPDDVFRRHGHRLPLNVVFLSILVFHGDAALNEYATVTALSPGRLFHFVVAPAVRSHMLKFAPNMKTSFGHQYQRLYHQ